MLGDSPLLVVLYVVGFFCVILAIAGTASPARPDGPEVLLLLGIGAVFAMVVVRVGVSPAERTHLFEYCLVAVLVHQALIERSRNGRRVPFPTLAAITVTVVLGWVDEWIQALLPNRVYDLRDVGTNAVAAVGATWASLVLASVRRKISDGSSANTSA